MRTLFMFSVFGFMVFVTWGLFIWWQSGYTKAYTTLDSLYSTQAKAIQFFPEQKPWVMKTPKFEFLKDDSSLKIATAVLVYQSIRLLNLMGLTCQCILIKLMILITAIPLFSITMLIGVIDGLSRRAIRTACLGRESSYLFHQLKKHSQKVMTAFIAFWLLLPVSIPPAFVFIPMSLVMGMLTAATVSHFKKYY